MIIRTLVTRLLVDPGERLITVKSWWPSFDRNGIWWPTILMETRAGQRQTSTRLWNRAHLAVLWEWITNRRTLVTLAVIAFLATGGAAWADIDPAPYLPNDQLTPGAIRPELTLAQICATKWGKDQRAVTEAMKMKVFREYGYPLGQKDPRCPCEIDHRQPRSIAGADVVANLSVQSYRGPWNAHDKDRVEDHAAKSICLPAGAMSLDDARAIFSGDWTKEYVKLFGVPADAR